MVFSVDELFVMHSHACPKNSPGMRPSLVLSGLSVLARAPWPRIN